MKPNAMARNVTSHGVTQSSAFGISSKDATHIMTILRDTLYSDKVLAVLREYSSNAWDANREAGRGDVPIKVVIPTVMNPTLIISDAGHGLSHEQVFTVYTQYGASTKRNSDTSVGMLGIGSKSGFAYSDSFTIVSSHDGMKRTYVALLDESDAGAIQLLHEEECGEETGVSIHIPVKPMDVPQFTEKARELFKHFRPRPEINVELPELPDQEVTLTHGALYTDQSEWVAVMGCVPYRLNLEQLRNYQHETGNAGIADFVFHKVAGDLYFDIGEVEVSASREELKYSDKTKAALVQKINDLVDEFVQTTLAAINNAAISDWNKRLRARGLAAIGMTIPKKHEEIISSTISFSNAPNTFRLKTKGKREITHVPVTSSTRLFFQDDDRDLEGFSLGTYEYIIEPSKLVPLTQLKTEFPEILKKLRAEGLPMGDLSSVAWFSKARRKGKVSPPNKKHQVKTFKLRTDKRSYHYPYSSNWTIVEKEDRDLIDDNSPFVLLSEFKSCNGFNIYDLYKRDKVWAEKFNVPIPPVYGYKITTKKHLKPEDCTGILYTEWRKGFHKSLLAAINPKLLEAYLHVSVEKHAFRYFDQSKKSIRQKLEILIEALGKEHQITKFFIQRAVAINKLSRFSHDKRVTVADMLSDVGSSLLAQSPSAVIYKQLMERYPLFQSVDKGIAELWEAYKTEWVKYVHLVDIHRTTALVISKQSKDKSDASASVHNNQ